MMCFVLHFTKLAKEVSIHHSVITQKCQTYICTLVDGLLFVGSFHVKYLSV